MREKQHTRRASSSANAGMDSNSLIHDLLANVEREATFDNPDGMRVTSQPLSTANDVHQSGHMARSHGPAQ